MHPVDKLTPPAPKQAATSENLRLPLNLADLDRWFSTAETGSTVAYHRGFLAMDRGAGSRLSEEAGEELDRIATAVMTMAEAGQVHLIQCRHGYGDYEYFAVMSGRGVRHRSARGRR